MILRWYDTGILPVWVDVLTDPQRALFLRPVTAWTYFDRFGDLCQLAMPEISPSVDAHVMVPFELNEDQHDTLFAACECDSGIMVLRGLMPEEIETVPYRVLYPFVAEHLQVARRHGIEKDGDIESFLALAVWTGGAYTEHPAVVERLAKPAREHDITLADWFAALPDARQMGGQPLWENAKGGEA